MKRMAYLFLILLFAGIQAYPTAYAQNKRELMVTNSANDGEGSLRALIREAKPNDTIVFSNEVEHITITEPIAVKCSLNISGQRENQANVMITGNSRLFEVEDIQEMERSLHLKHLTFSEITSDETEKGLIVNAQEMPLYIENCRFSENSGKGPLIASFLSDITIKQCLFRDNQSMHTTGASIVWAHLGTPYVYDSVFLGNASNSVLFAGSKGTFLINNLISNNTGAAIAGWWGTILMHNTITANTLSGENPAVWTALFMQNNIISGNKNDNGSGYSAQLGSELKPENNLIEGKPGSDDNTLTELFHHSMPSIDGKLYPAYYARSAEPIDFGAYSAVLLDHGFLAVNKNLNVEIAERLQQDRMGVQRQGQPVTFGAYETGLLTAIEASLETDNYMIGQTLDLSGLKVYAVYNDGRREQVTDFTTTVDNGMVLEESGNFELLISYTEADITKNVNLGITVGANEENQPKVQPYEVPQTGDRSLPVGFVIAIAALSLCLLFFLLIKRKAWSNTERPNK